MQLSQATGRLEFMRDDETAQLFFERGRAVFARTSGASVKAGQILVHRGLLRPDVLERRWPSRRGPARRHRFDSVRCSWHGAT